MWPEYSNFFQKWQGVTSSITGKQTSQTDIFMNRYEAPAMSNMFQATGSPIKSFRVSKTSKYMLSSQFRINHHWRHWQAKDKSKSLILTGAFNWLYKTEKTTQRNRISICSNVLAKMKEIELKLAKTHWHFKVSVVSISGTCQTQHLQDTYPTRIGHSKAVSDFTKP